MTAILCCVDVEGGTSLTWTESRRSTRFKAR